MTNTNEVLKTVRKFLGLTQKQFADKLGLKQSAYSMIESGTNKPSIDLIKSIAKQFKIDPKVFLEDYEENTINDILNTNNVNPNVNGNVNSDVINDENSGSGIEISNNELDEMIKYKLWYMDFYLIGMLYHTGRYQEKAGKGKFDEKIFDRENAYIKQYAGNTLENIPPAYEQMNAKEKVKLLRELDEVTKIMLDKIWLVTRTI
jgi:transcriptional regulator with XRE-family HTH domain